DMHCLLIGVAFINVNLLRLPITSYVRKVAQRQPKPKVFSYLVPADAQQPEYRDREDTTYDRDTNRLKTADTGGHGRHLLFHGRGLGGVCSGNKESLSTAVRQTGGLLILPRSRTVACRRL